MSCEIDDGIVDIEQGRTFAYVIGLDTDIKPDFFRDWSVKAQIRRYQNRTPSGFLADLEVTKLPDPDTNLFLIYHADTSKWPVGKVEMDFLLTHDTGSFKLPSETRVFNVKRVVTRT